MTSFYDNSSSSSKPVPLKTSRAQKIQILIFDNWKLILYGAISTLILVLAIMFSTLFFALPAANCDENSGKWSLVFSIKHKLEKHTLQNLQNTIQLMLKLQQLLQQPIRKVSCSNKIHIDLKNLATSTASSHLTTISSSATQIYSGKGQLW